MDETLQQIADRADIIVNGYAFTRAGEVVRVINLHQPDEALVIGETERVIETSMDDIAMSIVMDIFQANKQYLTSHA